MKNHLTVSLIQQACHRQKQDNLAHSIKQIELAARQGSDIAVLPELHLAPYFCQTENTDVFKQAESIPGETTEILSTMANKNNIIIVSTIFEKRAAGLYHNTAVVFEKNGEIAGKYRKMHIPDDPGYYEKFYFTPGDLGFTPIQTSVGKLGVLICWDQWYPEAARLMTLAGAELLIYPTAIGWDRSDTQQEQQRQLDAWITVQRGHAVANGLPVLACNRIGFEKSPADDSGIDFWGNSFIAGPQGELLAHANDEDTLLTVELDNTRISEVRNIWPFLRDRRIEEFSNLSRRYIDEIE